MEKSGKLRMPIAYRDLPEPGWGREKRRRPLGRGTEGPRRSVMWLSPVLRAPVLQGGHHAANVVGDDGCGFTGTIYEFRDATRRDPIAGGSNLKRGHYRCALIEDRHGDGVH